MSIPLDLSINDAVRNGLASINIPKDQGPVTKLLTSIRHTEEREKLEGYKHVYGVSAAQFLLQEKFNVSCSRPLIGTGIAPSNLSLEILMDRDDTIPMDSFSYLPSPLSETDRLGVNETVERRLGLPDGFGTRF